MKGQFSREYAEGIGQKIIGEVGEYCEKISLAGSIRRKKPMVGDIDIVAVPSSQPQTELLNRFRALGEGAGKGTVVLSIKVGDIYADLWLVPAKSWGAALCFATGSMEENIRLRAIAKRRGWKLNQYALTDAEGRVIDGETEESVYEALGVPFLSPEERG